MIIRRRYLDGHSYDNSSCGVRLGIGGGGGVRYEFLTWRRLDSTRGTDRFGFTRQALRVGRHRCAGMAPLNQTQILQGITSEMTPTLYPGQLWSPS